jgi:hypothetical protein
MTVAAQAGEGASVTPTLSQEEIDKIVAGVTEKYEERIKGFQRLIAERDQKEADLATQLEELKSADLPVEERVQLREQKLQRKVEELQAKLELEALTKDFPDEMPLYQKLVSATRPDEQLAILRELRSAATPAPAAAPSSADEDSEEPEVDLNNPIRRVLEGTTFDGVPVNDAWADAILGSMPRMRS